MAIFVLAVVVLSASFGQQISNQAQPAKVRTGIPISTSLAQPNIATSVSSSSLSGVGVSEPPATSSQQGVSQSSNQVSASATKPNGVHSSNLISSSTFSSNTRHLGFWVGEGDIFGNLRWSAQTFVNNYFKTTPYPSALLFATGGGYAYPEEVNWLSEVLSITDTMNVKVILLCFVNLSGGTINGRPDQTSSFTTFMNSLKGHPSLYGAEYENEYFGHAVQEVGTFKSIVNGAGYTDILNPNSNMMSTYPSDPVLDYSQYPYFNGIIPSSLPNSARAIGIGYGETGSPPSGEANPIWTQTVI
ncbi:MAG: hypothetical protein ACRECH_16990, partial [Nitrososphaerales archaeon]